MQNTPRLPAVALVIALTLGAATLVSIVARTDAIPDALTELEIGLAGVAFTLVVFGVQGLVSVLLEGRELRPGRVSPRLTNPLSLAIVVFSVALFVISVFLGVGILEGWGPEVIGLLAGGGCIILALLLVLYKEAFVGDEASFDDCEDGVPW